jgi:hypothetical protein
MSKTERGYTLVDTTLGGVLVGVIGLIVYSILNMGMVLGAKNTAVNTAHQQARTAMLQMLQDLHSAISLPQVVDINGNPIAAPSPGASPSPAPGISFQTWAGGPYKVGADATTSQATVQITMPATAAAPAVGERLIVPTHQIEDDITTVMQNNPTTYTVTLAHNLPAAISGTGNPTFFNIVCYITDRCSYIVKNQQLTWNGPTSRKAIMGQDITSANPFNTPTTPAGALYYRFVAAIDLSTCDLAYNNRGFKSANILLNGQVPMRARLTTYQ